MAAMLLKNALQLSVRARPAASSVRALSALSSSSSSFSVAHPAVLLASPHMNALVHNPLVFETNISRHVQIDDLFSPIGELECPTESLNEPLQAIKRTYQPSVLRRKRKHGFRTRRVSISGRKVLNRRFNKKRWRMSL